MLRGAKQRSQHKCGILTTVVILVPNRALHSFGDVNENKLGLMYDAAWHAFMVVTARKQIAGPLRECNLVAIDDAFSILVLNRLLALIIQRAQISAGLPLSAPSRVLQKKRRDAS